MKSVDVGVYGERVEADGRRSARTLSEGLRFSLTHQNIWFLSWSAEQYL